MTVTVELAGPEGHTSFFVRLLPTRANWPADLTPDELAALQVHAERLREAAAQGRCVLAGPVLDGSLGVAVWDGMSLDELLAELGQDPMVEKRFFDAVVSAMRLSFERTR